MIGIIWRQYSDSRRIIIDIAPDRNTAFSIINDDKTASGGTFLTSPSLHGLIIMGSRYFMPAYYYHLRFEFRAATWRFLER